MGRVLALVSLLTALMVLTAGCARQPLAVSHGGPVKDYVSLVDNLRARGATVQPAGEVSQDWLSITGRSITVNGENVQVFEYADESSANAEATSISPGGSEIRAQDSVLMVTWMAPPHFYKAGRVIVLYVGSSPTVTDVLRAALGQQFAGK